MQTERERERESYVHIRMIWVVDMYIDGGNGRDGTDGTDD